MKPTETRLALLRNGYSPLPVNGKAPPLESWQQKTETNVDEIQLWEKLFPSAHSTGVLTQRTPAIDIDVSHQLAAVAVEDLARKMFSDEGTFLVRIGRAPKRAIPFRTNAPFKKIVREYVGKFGEVHKLEILCDGQQVVVDGIHPDTQKPYSWAPASLDRIPHDDLPVLDEKTALAFVEEAEKVLAEYGIEPLKKKSDAKKDDGDQERTRVDWRDSAGLILTGASYHDELARLSSSAAALGMPQHACEGILGALLDCSNPPNSQRQERCNAERWKLGATVSSAYSKFGTTDTAAHSKAPLDLWGNFEPPALPCGLLPKVIEDFALAQSDLMGADAAGLAMSALTVCAAAIPDCVELQVKQHDPGWRESARLWVALIGPPSTKKSPIIRQAARPLARLDDDLAREYAAKRAAYDSLPADERKAAEPPKKKRFRIEDTTIEAAQEILKDSPNGVLSLQDELSGFFGAMDKYNSGKGSHKDRGFWLQAWNGGSYVADRISRGQTFIPNLSISLLGGIQPDPLRKVVSDTVDDGLIQRLIPIVLRGSAAGRDEEQPDAVGPYERLVARLAGKEPLFGFRPAPPLLVKFTPAAQVVRRRLEQRHIDLMVCEAVYPKLGAHLGKYDGFFARLCLTWHCIEARWTDDISEATALRVEQFLHQFLLPHAVSFYAGLLKSESHGILADVAAYILAHELIEITNRDLARCVRAARGLTKTETKAVFEQLDALGWVTPMPGPRPSSPPRWMVNPICRQLFADRARMEQSRRQNVRETLKTVFA